MRIRIAGLAGLFVLLAACDDASPERGDAGAMPVAAEGAQIYTEYCALCHGASGRGDGRLASEMTRQPADLTRLAAQNGGTFPTAAVLSKIDGYIQADSVAPVMPEFGELLAGDTVPYDSGDGIETPTPRRLVALVEYLRTIQAGP
ncbi:Cytochrome c [Roseivivax jejudonensis]|uniref:Cytochrome c n=1 Tax=Roseivivax jejudonensis TaxID=1529041 RepID=A0A1X7AAW6_9RHOB|nr:c-type cytochrome [Roseivivax jejudonensis]SLN74366.1 Cytochrome c [Roseivivax jejudonensis]